MGDTPLVSFNAFLDYSSKKKRKEKEEFSNFLVGHGTYNI